MNREIRDRRIHAEFAVASRRRTRGDFDRFRMDDRRRRPHRILGDEHRRQLRIRDIDELECGLGDLDGIGRDRRDLLADEACHTLGKQGDVLAQTAVARIGHIGAGQHGMNAGQRLGAPHIDRDDARAGMRAAQAAAEQSARQLDIAGIAGAAGHLGDAVHALDGKADSLAAQFRCRHAMTAPHSSQVVGDSIGRVQSGKDILRPDCHGQGWCSSLKSPLCRPPRSAR